MSNEQALTKPVEVDRFVVTLTLSAPASVGESVPSIESYLRDALEVSDLSITSMTVVKRGRGARW